MARLPRRGDVLEGITIEALSREGLGVAEVPIVLGPQSEETVLKVELGHTLPGDEVDVEVRECRRRRVGGTIKALSRASALRIEPRCAHFGPRVSVATGCGGCRLQHLSYRDQLAHKERLVFGLLEGALPEGALSEEARRSILGMADPFRYRNKMELSFGDDGSGSVGLGMHPAGFRYEVIPLSECHLMPAESVALVRALREWAVGAGLAAARRGEGLLEQLMVRDGHRTGERMLELMTVRAPEAEAVGRAFGEAAREAAERLGVALTSVYWTEKHAERGQRTQIIAHHLAGKAFLEEALELPGGERLRFQIHPRAFFQPNTRQAEVLYAEVLDAAGLAPGTRRGHVLDLYCGTGSIGLAMAPYAARVTGVELNADAVDNARANAALNGIAHARFEVGDVGKVLAAGGLPTSDIDVVVVDPPRAGLFPEALAHISALAAPRLVYVSCNPEALARDLVGLIAAGYAVEQVRPVDMFPHTAHVETVVRLTLRSSR